MPSWAKLQDMSVDYKFFFLTGSNFLLCWQAWSKKLEKIKENQSVEEGS